MTGRIPPASIAWMRFAACAGVDPDLMFPERGQSAAPGKAVCDGCPVRAPCLDHALTHHENWGVWGGTSEKERRRMRRTRRETAKPRCSIPGCDGTPKAYGWCHTHYMRWRRTGNVSGATPRRTA